MGEHTVGEEREEFLVSAPHKPFLHALSPDHIEETDSLIGFWWVGTTPVKKEANMELGQITMKSCLIPVLTNTEVIPAHTQLKRFKERAAAPVPLK